MSYIKTKKTFKIKNKIVEDCTSFLYTFKIVEIWLFFLHIFFI
jgi:hypothetical protein